MSVVVAVAQEVVGWLGQGKRAEVVKRLDALARKVWQGSNERLIRLPRPARDIQGKWEATLLGDRSNGFQIVNQVGVVTQSVAVRQALRSETQGLQVSIDLLDHFRVLVLPLDVGIGCQCAPRRYC